MVKLETILENYSEWETFLDDRFGRRLAQFLPDEDLSKIGFEHVPETGDESREVKEWNEENILAQLKEDVEFAWEKACNERGISAGLMVDVVQKWCWVLENRLGYDEDHEDYGKAFLRTVDNFYGWHLTDTDVAEEGYVQKMWGQGMNVVGIK